MGRVNGLVHTLPIFRVSMDELERQKRIEFLEHLLVEPMWYNYVEFVDEYHELKKKAMGNWSIEKTAFVLGKSLATLNRDLRLARAVRINPELKKCRDRNDAESRIGRGSK